jgi:hypothetical protein
MPAANGAGDEMAKLVSAGADVIIRFERKNGGERSTAGYFDLKDVPLLKSINLYPHTPGEQPRSVRASVNLADRAVT